MRLSSFGFFGSAALAALLLVGGDLKAADSSQPTLTEKIGQDQGLEIVKTHCSSCHAITLDDVSRHDQAPPFREIVKRYPPETLAEALAEGIVSGHPDMPVFVFGPADVDAIVRYLESLEQSVED